MTIDEAIKQFKYDAECNRADLDLSYAEDNEQVAEWLEELKALREEKSDFQIMAKDIAEGNNEILVDTLHLRLEQLKDRNNA